MKDNIIILTDTIKKYDKNASDFFETLMMNPTCVYDIQKSNLKNNPYYNKILDILSEYDSYIYIKNIESKYNKTSASNSIEIFEFYKKCLDPIKNYELLKSLKYFNPNKSKIKKIFDTYLFRNKDYYIKLFENLKTMYAESKDFNKIKEYLIKVNLYNTNFIWFLIYSVDFSNEDKSILLDIIKNIFVDIEEVYILKSLLDDDIDIIKQFINKDIKIEPLVNKYNYLYINFYGNDVVYKYLDFLNKYKKIKVSKEQIDSELEIINRILSFYNNNKNIDDLIKYIGHIYTLNKKRLYEMIIRAKYYVNNSMYNSINEVFLQIFKKLDSYIYAYILILTEEKEEIIFEYLYNIGINKVKLNTLYSKVCLYPYSIGDINKIKLCINKYINDYDNIVINIKKEKFKKVENLYKNNINTNEIYEYINNELNLKKNSFAKMKFEIRHILTKEELDNYNKIIRACFYQDYSQAVIISNILSIGFKYIYCLLEKNMLPSRLEYTIMGLHIDKYNLTALELQKIKLFITKYTSSYNLKKGKNLLIKKELQEKEKNTKLNENLVTAIDIVTDYIENKGEGTSKDLLDSVKTLKYFDHPLYTSYVNYQENKMSKNYAVILNTIRKMIELILSGIEVGDRIRPFDILDYYSMTKLGFYQLLDIARCLDESEYRVLKQFTRRNTITYMLNISDIYKTETIIGVKFDKNNHPISGTGRVIKYEEKKYLIDYLINNNIPVNQVSYKALFDRYINGYFNMNSNNTKIKF